MTARILFLLFLPCFVFAADDAKQLDIAVDDKPRLRYMYDFDTSTPELAHATYKVYSHVLDTEGQEITKGAGGKFTHHRGLYIGWSRIGFQGKRYDLWHMKGTTIEHQEIVEQKQDDKTSILKVKLHWKTGEGTVVLEEIRSFTVHHDGESYLLVDFVSELHAVTDDVDLNGDPEHAGMQYRPHNDVAGNKSAKYTYHKEGVNISKERDAPWAAMTYKLRDKDWAVQHMNHPNNPKGTRYSAYRDYGRFGAFAVAKIAKGESLTLRYRIRITEGSTPARDVLDAQYKAFTGG
jgi:hypothetical protein